MKHMIEQRCEIAQMEQFVALIIEQKLYELCGIMDFDATLVARKVLQELEKTGKCYTPFA